MRRLLLVPVASLALVFSSAAVAAADDDAVRIFSFLSSRQEVQDPPVDARSFGFARGEVTFHDDETASIQVHLGLRIRSGTDITRFHIHRGGFGSNGPIVVNFFDTVPTPGREPDPDTIPVRKFTRLSFSVDDVPAELAAEIVAFPKDFYFNVHTQAFAAGEVRGQLLSFDD